MTAERPMVEILYLDGCPNHQGLEDHIRKLLTAAGVDLPIRQRRIDSAAEAQTEQFLGSPTVRVNGIDVDPTAAAQSMFGLSCRVYQTADGLRGTPFDEWILRAVRDAASPTKSVAVGAPPSFRPELLAARFDEVRCEARRPGVLG